MNRNSEPILMVPSEHILRGDQLAPWTLLRCEEGLTLFRRGGFSHILLSGGIFEPWQSIAAAELMKVWFLDRGVPRSQILVESDSVDTFQNVEFGLRVLRSTGLRDAPIHVVSEWHHAVRIAITFWLGYRRRVTRHTVSLYRLRPFESMAEWLYILTHFLDPCGQFLPWVKWNRRRRAWRE